MFQIHKLLCFTHTLALLKRYQCFKFNHQQSQNRRHVLQHIGMQLCSENLQNVAKALSQSNGSLTASSTIQPDKLNKSSQSHYMCVDISKLKSALWGFADGHC